MAAGDSFEDFQALEGLSDREKQQIMKGVFDVYDGANTVAQLSPEP